MYEDLKGASTKLQQACSVNKYQAQFERLSNQTIGLSEGFFLSCYVSGLKEEIWAAVRMFKPTTIMQAIRLARLQEENVAILKKYHQENLIYANIETNLNVGFPTLSI